MSTEEDPELRDLVAKCLENSGVLGKIRAQLRACTYLSLDQQEDPKVTFPINNAAVQQYAASRNGAITLSLIREFLSFYNMQFSLSVFDPESCENTSYNHLSRKNLASELNLTNDNPDEPLLHTLLTELLQLKITSSTAAAPSAGETMVNHKEKPREKSVNNKNGSLINGDDYDEDFQSSSSSSISKKGDVNENSMNNPPISVEEELDVSTSDLLKSQSSNGGNDTMDKSTSNSNLASAEYVENLRK